MASEDMALDCDVSVLAARLQNVAATLKQWQREGPPGKLRAEAEKLGCSVEAGCKNLQQIVDTMVATQIQEAVQAAQQDASAREARIRADAERREAEASALLARTRADAEQREATAERRRKASESESQQRLEELRAEVKTWKEHAVSFVPSVSVSCRIRPESSYADAGNARKAVNVNGNRVHVDDVRNGHPGKDFLVDNVLQVDASQEDVYRLTEPLMENVQRGGSSCVFAYGATGAGKTHSILGSLGSRDAQKKPGLAHQALKRLMAGGGSVRISMLELYNDSIRDLFGELRTLPQSSAMSDCVQKEASTPEEAHDFVDHGFTLRATRGTKCNESSSRSHVVLTVQLTGPTNASQANSGRLVLVDLAGSEDIRKSGADNLCESQTEAININRSLTVLASVVDAVAKGKTHVPYRDSKLTKLLEPVLGNSKNCFLIHISPWLRDEKETKKTLQFAENVRGIQFADRQKDKELHQKDRELQDSRAEFERKLEQKDKALQLKDRELQDSRGEFERKLEQRDKALQQKNAVEQDNEQLRASFKRDSQRSEESKERLKREHQRDKEKLEKEIQDLKEQLARSKSNGNEQFPSFSEDIAGRSAAAKTSNSFAETRLGPPRRASVGGYPSVGGSLATGRATWEAPERVRKENSCGGSGASTHHITEVVHTPRSHVSSSPDRAALHDVTNSPRDVIDATCTGSPIKSRLQTLQMSRMAGAEAAPLQRSPSVTPTRMRSPSTNERSQTKVSGTEHFPIASPQGSPISLIRSPDDDSFPGLTGASSTEAFFVNHPSTPMASPKAIRFQPSPSPCASPVEQPAPRPDHIRSTPARFNEYIVLGEPKRLKSTLRSCEQEFSEGRISRRAAEARRCLVQFTEDEHQEKSPPSWYMPHYQHRREEHEQKEEQRREAERENRRRVNSPRQSAPSVTNQPRPATPPPRVTRSSTTRRDRGGSDDPPRFRF